MRESDYVCPINDRECGDDRGLWCRRCPKRKPKITEAEEFIANLRQQMQTGMDLEAYIAHACFENFIEAKIGDYEVTYHRGVARLYNLLSGDLLDEKIYKRPG